MQTDWTPEKFMSQHGKLWLGGVKAQEENTCAKMCLLANQRTTHFTFEGKTKSKFDLNYFKPNPR